jgi:hypothetical protein
MRQSVIGSTSRSSANPLWLIPSFWARYVSTCHCDRVNPEPRALCSNLFLSNRATSCSKKSRVDEFAFLDVLTSNRYPPQARLGTQHVRSRLPVARCPAHWHLSVAKSNDAERLLPSGPCTVVNDPRDFNQLHGVWNGYVKGSQPFHQLIPMATRSSTRHKLIWFSPQLVGAVVRNLLSIWDACWPMSVFSAA